MTPNGNFIRAVAFDQDSGEPEVPGSLRIDRQGVHFHSDTLEERIPADRLNVTLGGDEETLFFTDSTRPALSIHTQDPAVLDSPALPQLQAIRHRLREARGRRHLMRSLRLTLWAVAACVLLGWLGSWALGAMVRSLAAHMPIEGEREFGLAQLEALGGRIIAGGASNQLARLAAPLLAVLPKDGPEIAFHLVEDPEPNAWAIPGGQVVVNSGLLALAERPEELLGVIAHELAHVTQRHQARRAIAGGGALMVARLFLQGRSRLGTMAGLASGAMVFQSFSKEFETEADDVGWKYMVAANINPRGMISMFEKLQAYAGRPRHTGRLARAFESHPEVEKRIARLESRWRKLARHDGFISITEPLPSVPATNQVSEPPEHSPKP